MYQVNLFGLMEVTQAFAPQVIAAKGQVINIGSIVGVIPTPLQGVYNSSKAAVHSLSDALRIEMAPFGVKVICVSPTLVAIPALFLAMLLIPFAGRDGRNQDAVLQEQLRLQLSRQFAL